MAALCNITPHLGYSALILFSGLYLYFSLLRSICVSKQLYSSSYIVRIASLQGNHSYFSQNQEQKQDKTKLENI